MGRRLAGLQQAGIRGSGRAQRLRAPGCQAHGIGRSLLSAFIAAAEDAGVWTIQSGIFPENAASLSLHQALGFRVVGTRERVGRHHGLWRDVLLIERRSIVTGT
ncbi:GNAT family N-acetyltransferase [Nonomuraea sp. NPDC046570]|uniref:GNAT family N-acetyltransferase n=1 Tax=Nonomuraea sp. NPDC046570 TaxID=3155255 RepID=UPI0033D6ACB2